MVGSRSVLRKPLTWVVVGTVVLALVGGGLLWFQPWKLVVDQTVDEAAPGVAPTADGAPTAQASPGQVPGSPSSSRLLRNTPTVVAHGQFISHEHQTTGVAEVIDLGNGRRILRLQNLRTSNGPDLRVWITDAPVKEGTAGWRVFDDGKHVELGALKGNRGSQNYDLPAGVDLAQLNSVTIWCVRFGVSFGAAALRLV